MTDLNGTLDQVSNSSNGTLDQISDNPLVAFTRNPAGLPVPQPTGSPVPQPTAAPAPVSGGASLGDILMSRGQSVPKFNSPHVQNIGDSAAKTLQNNPEAAKQPAGWARALVGGALDALKGVGDSLGDVAAVGTVPAGAGGLTGVARTLQARQQRQRQQRLDIQEADKTKQMMAESNVRMIHEQRLVHQLDETAKQTSVDSGLRQIDVMRKQAAPAPILGEHLDSDQIAQFIKEKKMQADDHTAVPDGVKNVGTDKDGNPITRLTYTIMGVPPDVQLDPKDSQDKKTLDELNKYAPPANGGKWGDGGTQRFTGTEFNLAFQHSNDVRAATLARNQQLINADMATQKQVQDLESVNFRGVTDWVNALSNAKNGDVIAARNAMLANKAMRDRYPNLDNDLREYYGKDEKTGVYNYDKLLEKHQENLDKNLENINSLQKELDKAHGEDAAAIAAGIQSKMSDPSTPAEAKPRLQKMLNQANSQARASLDYSVNKKRQEAEAELKAGEGDLSAVQDMALNYEFDPDKLFSRFKGQKQKIEFLARMHAADPTWSEAEYRARYNTKNDYRPQGKGGQAVQSLNTFAGHIGDANNLVDTLHNTGSPLLNTPLNKIKKEVLGQPQFIAYKTATAAAADEYLNYLLNQHAKHESDDKLAAQLTSEDTSPAAAQAMFRQMANTIAIRARAQNKVYRDQMGGKDIPNFLDPDTEQVLRSFGIDPKQVTTKGQSGLVGNKLPQNQPKPAQGMARIKTPSGTLMDFPEGSDQYKQAIANGATAVNQ